MRHTNTPSSNTSPKLLDQVRDRLRTKHYSIRTETQYLHWIKRFILFHGKRHPKEMGPKEVEIFLTHLAVEGRVSASTQNQALSALLFLYREILESDLPWLDDVIRAKKPQRLPVVLTRQEVEAIIGRVDGTYGLMLRLLYGTGMRLMECVRLRVKDVDFERREILIRDGKGAKDRVTMLPAVLVDPLKEHFARRRMTYDDDTAGGRAEVYLPDALARKYPNAATEWGWQYVFSSGSYSIDPRSGRERRHHLDEKQVQRAMKKAVNAAGIAKLATPHTLRHEFWQHTTVAYECINRKYKTLSLTHQF